MARFKMASITLLLTVLVFSFSAFAASPPKPGCRLVSKLEYTISKRENVIIARVEDTRDQDQSGEEAIGTVLFSLGRQINVPAVGKKTTRAMPVVIRRCARLAQTHNQRISAALG